MADIIKQLEYKYGEKIAATAIIAIIVYLVVTQ
jgi:hypothetical protein